MHQYEKVKTQKSLQCLLTLDVARGSVFSRVPANGVNGSLMKCDGKAINNLTTDFFYLSSLNTTRATNAAMQEEDGVVKFFMLDGSQ